MDLFDIAVASKLAGGGGGGGGGSALEYEMGVIQPSGYIDPLVIPFQNQHSKPPTIFAVTMADDNLESFAANQFCLYFDAETLAGKPYPGSSSAYKYGGFLGSGMKSGSSTTRSSQFRFPQGEAGENGEYPSYFCSNTQITARVPGSNVKWNSNKQYVWFAVWVTVPNE